VSEAVFNIVQLAQQAADVTAVDAKTLFPVDAGAVIDEDRSPTSPDEDYGENAIGQPSRGTYGLRGASISLTGECRAEDFGEILSMHAAGGVGHSDPHYSWVYPWDLTSNSLKRYTIEGGVVGTANDQWRAVGCLCNSLEFGFDALTAPGNAPWRFTADIQALFRQRDNLTATTAPYSPLETFEGHMTQLFEGDTDTVYGSLAESAASLKSFKLNSEMNLVRRAYGGSVDYASGWGYSGRKALTFTAELGINNTTKAAASDIYEAAGSLMGERRWRVTARGSRLASQNEVQTFTTNADGGTFTLTFMGYTTAAIAFGADNATVQTAVRLLPPLVAGANVTVGGAGASPWTFTFANVYASLPVSQMRFDDSALTNSGGAVVSTLVVTTPGGLLKTMTLDFRCRFNSVNVGNVDGERVYTVEGICVKDPTTDHTGTGTDMRATILNGIATQLTL
jgi:hypothetical protein